MIEITFIDMKKLSLLIFLFFSSLSHGEEIAIACETQKQFQTGFDNNGYDDGKFRMYDRGREEVKLSNWRKNKEYILIDKTTGTLEMDSFWGRSIKYSVDEEAYRWGLYTKSVWDGNTSINKRITQNEFENPESGRSVSSNFYKILRGSLRLSEDEVYLTDQITYKTGLKYEFFSDCSIIPLEELKQIRKKSLEHQLEKEKERKKNQKI